MINTDFTPFPILETEHLTLRALVPDDEKEIFAIRSNEEINKYLDRPLQSELSEARLFIEKIVKGVKENRWIYWAISLKENSTLIGTICIWNINQDESKGEVGFELLPFYQGKGIMQEALPPVIDYGFKKIKLESLEGEVDPENIKSVKLMEKFGFTKINYLRETDSDSIKKGKTVIFELHNRGE